MLCGTGCVGLGDALPQPDHCKSARGYTCPEILSGQILCALMRSAAGPGCEFQLLMSEKPQRFGWVSGISPVSPKPTSSGFSLKRHMPLLRMRRKNVKRFWCVLWPASYKNIRRIRMAFLIVPEPEQGSL